MKIGIVGLGVVGSAIRVGFEKIGHEELCEIRKVFTQNLDDLTGCFIKEKNFKKTFMFMFDINHDTADFFIDEYGLKERLRGNQPLTDDDFEDIIKLLGQSSFCGVSNFDEYLITSIIKALIKSFKALFYSALMP